MTKTEDVSYCANINNAALRLTKHECRRAGERERGKKLLRNIFRYWLENFPAAESPVLGNFIDIRTESTGMAHFGRGCPDPWNIR